MSKFREVNEGDKDYTLLRKVLDRYKCNVTGIQVRVEKWARAVWIVKTQKGLKYLKKPHRPEAILRYIIEATMYLRSRGVRVPKICSTKENERYVIEDNTCFVLMDECKGKRPNYRDDKQLEAVTKELAAFHVASRGFRPSPECEPLIFLGSWPLEYVEWYNRLMWIGNNCSMQGGETKGEDFMQYKDFEKMALEQLPQLLPWAKWSAAQLEKSSYPRWLEKVREGGGLCHNDFQRGNLLIDDEGRSLSWIWIPLQLTYLRGTSGA